MSKLAKPLFIVIVAVVAAGGAGMFLARRPTSTASPAQVVTPANSGRSKGPANAPVTLIEFGDYQCPSCAFYHPIVTEVLKRYPTQVRLEFHHYPLVNIHQFAMSAALAAEAAGDQGKFWEMHDLIYVNQEKWSKMANAEAEFLTYAGRLGLNINQFMQAMRSPDTQQRVLADVTRGREANVNGTPSFFVNGKKIENPAGVDAFSAVIQEHLPK